MSRIYLNDNWKFTCDVNADVQEIVRLPHTCKELPFHYFSENEYQMVSDYEKMLFVPESWSDKVVLLTIDGAAHFAEVFVNGEKCGEHGSGYTAFTLDISKYLKLDEENEIIIRVDSREKLNVPPFGHVIDYLTYGGIYREVYLDVKEPEYIQDVFVKPDITGNCVSEVTVAGNTEKKLRVRQGIYLDGELICRTEVPVKTTPLSIGGFVENVKLWDIDSPVLYQVKTELICEEKVLDVHEVKVGFRSAEFMTDGFYLNGRKLKIRGLNRHQSYPYVGYAMPKSIQENDADILKYELGLNSVRTSHYPQSQYFIDRCDEIGLLVFTEFPGWQHIGDALWKRQAVKNVEEMILQYRNHPSIILWGVRINESADDEAFYIRTNEVAHKLDPTRQTGGVRCIKNSQLLEDVYTYNDFIHDGKTPGCEPKAKVTSDMNKPYLVTEYNGHMYPTKNYDCEDHRTEHALRHVTVLEAVDAQEDICGSYGWCMADYNTHKDFGSGDRICYHGVLDMFRNPKTAAAVYACRQDEVPVLEISSSMDIGEHPDSRRSEVWVFSNADSVKMYKNGKLLKEYRMDKRQVLLDDYVGNDIFIKEKYSEKQAQAIKDVLNYIAVYGSVEMTPKFLKLAAKCLVKYRMKRDDLVQLYTKYVGDWGETATEYRFEAIKNGEVVKTITKKPMKKVSLKVKVSSEVLEEKNSYDVAAIRIHVVDENDNRLYFFMEPVKLTIDGPLELIGPDMVSFKGGMTGTYVKTMGEKGTAVLTLSGAQFEPVTISFEIK